MGWRGRYYGNPWPGNGPWSWMPPHLRPGYWAGRGWCGLYAQPTPPRPWCIVDGEVELKYLEELKKYLTDYLKTVEKRIEEIKSSGERGHADSSTVNGP